MGTSMRLGVLDLGSNSFQLLAAEAWGPNEVLERGLRRTAFCFESSLRRREGEGELELHARHLARQQGLDAVGGLIRWARALQEDLPILAVGKTGLQDTDAGIGFLQAVQRRYGINVELLSGEDEAKLTYRGVRSRLSEFRDRLGVIDIGGGSVEVSVGQRRFCFFGESLPLGFLRIQDLDDAQLTDKVGSLCSGAVAGVTPLAPARWLFSGGTSRAFGRVAMALGLMRDGQIEQAEVGRLAEHLQQISAEQLGALGVPANRTGMFPRAARLLAELVSRFEIPAIGVSTGGLRQGIVLREYERATFNGMTAKNHRANWDGLG